MEEEGEREMHIGVIYGFELVFCINKGRGQFLCRAGGGRSICVAAAAAACNFLLVGRLICPGNSQ